MKRVFSVAIRALVFGVIIYFFLEELLPKTQQSDIVFKSKEKIEAITKRNESKFEVDEESGIAYYLSNKQNIKKSKVRIQLISTHGKLWDTLNLNESNIGEDRFMYWIEIKGNKPQNIEIIEE